MLGRDERSRRIGLGFLVPFALLFTSESGLAWSPRLLPDASSEAAAEKVLARAVRNAEEKLADPECRLVFSDFQDREGRTLQQSLDSSGEEASTFLAGSSSTAAAAVSPAGLPRHSPSLRREAMWSSSANPDS